MKKHVVSFLTPTSTEPLGFTPASVMSLSLTNMTSPFNSGHEASLWDPEQRLSSGTSSGVFHVEVSYKG